MLIWLKGNCGEQTSPTHFWILHFGHLCSMKCFLKVTHHNDFTRSCILLFILKLYSIQLCCHFANKTYVTTISNLTDVYILMFSLSCCPISKRSQRLTICNIPFFPSHFLLYPLEVCRAPRFSLYIEVCKLLYSILLCTLGSNVCKAEPFLHIAWEFLCKESQTDVRFHIFWSNILVDFL